MDYVKKNLCLPLSDKKSLMARQADQTASFVVRFTQKIYEDQQGEDHVQWRGKISHVQGGDQINFTDFHNAISFIQEKLAQLTVASTEDRTKEEQEGLLQKSFDIWKRVAKEGPKMVIEAIKDPKKQVAQIQEQITQVSDEWTQKIELDDWRTASRSDLNKVVESLDHLTQQVSKLSEKVDLLSGKE